MKRAAKGEIAQEMRGNQKYKNQKGSIQKSKRSYNQHGRRATAGEEEDEDEMVVVRNGQPVKVGGHTGKAMAVEEADDEREPGRFTATEKKIRAIHKKLRQLQQLKQQKRQGIELDAQQQAKLRGEAEVVAQLEELEAALEREKAEGSDEGDESEGEEEQQPEDMEDEADEEGESDDDNDGCGDENGDGDERSENNAAETRVRKSPAAAAPVTLSKPAAPNSAMSHSVPEGKAGSKAGTLMGGRAISKLSKLEQKRALKLSKRKAQLDAKMARVQSKEVEAAQRVEARRVASQQAQRKLARK